MEYKSKISLLGFPLIHCATGRTESGACKRGVARGWIAIGDCAFGIIFAAGGVACGTMAVGGLSLGIFSIAGLAAGIFAWGGLAAGVYAFGGLALAFHASSGGLAIAYHYALGGAAFAEQANNDAARNVMNSSLFFNVSNAAAKYAKWGILLALVSAVASAAFFKGIRKN